MIEPKLDRTEPRKTLRCAAMVTLKNEPALHGRTIDISESGISVMVPKSLAPGAPCVIAFMAVVHDKTIAVNAAARVVYSICVGTTGFRSGFQFVQIDETTARAIRKIAS